MTRCIFSLSNRLRIFYGACEYVCNRLRSIYSAYVYVCNRIMAHYGPVYNWTTGTFGQVWSLSTSSRAFYGPSLADYTIRVDLQMTAGNNATVGVLALCNIRLLSNLGVRYYLNSHSYVRVTCTYYLIGCCSVCNVYQNV
jgi:hypothetical protein